VQVIQEFIMIKPYFSKEKVAKSMVIIFGFLTSLHLEPAGYFPNFL